MALQELQKSWDLGNWGIDLLFRCLDDSTPRTLRLSDDPVVQVQGDTCESSHAAEHIPDASIPMTPATRDRFVTASVSSANSITAANKRHGLFNSTDDYTDVVETSPSQADSVIWRDSVHLAFCIVFLMVNRLHAKVGQNYVF
ncbi:hypothetical protein Asppvi_010180 [Aspergillus pseudoviridinutans]|uniref:Uncharacterized protein n=1 Tax=Aspergillus pseudoviridinutans TaxID=1517512 RepID=A0A9P3BKX7_9EURO|nr:uncharacterized protein Asppvi_010180 [Aspergillus pseudoviridinutans]GIJ91215.1 hypothetical protein Asppvi_010180 [Aspergillus pseudoviridinutans]